jgi:GNAT superfamily N-acetyltransferase
MHEVYRRAELAEAHMMAHVEVLAPPELRASHGIALTRIAGATVLSMREDPTRYWSKAVGFTEPVTADLVGEIVDFYQAQGNPRATIQVPPWAMPDDWSAIVDRYHLTRGAMIVKLGARVDEVIPHTTDLRIGEISGEDTGAWSGTALAGFGMAGVGLEPLFARFKDVPGHHMYAAWSGADLVSVAALTAYREVGYGNTAATLPAYRGRGAQSALISLRAREAAGLGCEWYVSDTGMPDEGDNSNPSYNNMRRAGLRILYTRRNWIWTA